MVAMVPEAAGAHRHFGGSGRQRETVGDDTEADVAVGLGLGIRRGDEIAGSSRLAARTPAAAATEAAAASALIWMGRVAIAVAFLVGKTDIGGFRVAWFAVMMLGIYVSYLVTHWPATQSRQIEAVALGCVATGIAGMYSAALVLLW